MILLDVGGRALEENKGPERCSERVGSPAVVPFLKWAGGKRWLADGYGDLFPRTFHRYIEPFLGGGSIYFWLRPKNALLSDSNFDLISTYRAIRDNWRAIEKILARHHANHCSTYYYGERSRRRISAAEKAAQFIYLNRTCWNGLYRVNLKGDFNVPIGTKSAVLMDADNFCGVARLLKGARLEWRDFEDTIFEAGSGDFLYVDPPYTVNHNYNGFLKYNEKIFSWKDQMRLRDAVVAAINRGASVVVSNADHKSIRELYAGIGKHHKVRRKSVISGSASGRGAVKELLVLS